MTTTKDVAYMVWGGGLAIAQLHIIINTWIGPMLLRSPIISTVIILALIPLGKMGIDKLWNRM